MAASASDLQAGIQPDSTEYGDRQTLEAGIGAAVGAGGAAGGGGAASAAPPLDSSRDPMAALISGDLNPKAEGVALTDGLSVGPGDSPTLSATDTQHAKLLQLAQHAPSPLVRAAARAELRVRVSRPV